MTTKILFHSYGTTHCPDGFASAYSAWRKYRDTAIYIPVVYQNGQNGDIAYQEYLDSHCDFTSEDEVFILDWSAPRAILENIKGRVAFLKILDHHKSAQEALLGLDFAIFDMTKSGAMLSWEYFNPDLPAPALIRYIQDRDLWRKELPHTESAHLGLSAIKQAFEIWDELAQMNDEEYLDAVRMLGDRLLAKKEAQIDEWISGMEWIELGGYKILALEVTNPSLISDGLNKICRDNPESPFSASWQFKDGKKIWSLRSIGDFDVSAVAQSLGGGGHRNAAGFTEIP